MPPSRPAVTDSTQTPRSTTGATQRARLQPATCHALPATAGAAPALPARIAASEQRYSRPPPPKRLPWPPYPGSPLPQRRAPPRKRTSYAQRTAPLVEGPDVGSAHSTTPTDARTRNRPPPAPAPYGENSPNAVGLCSRVEDNHPAAFDPPAQHLHAKAAHKTRHLKANHAL
jgi:hypothetical protein